MKQILITGLVSLGLVSSAQAGFLETFETETALTTTFSEAGGPVFTADGDLMVEFFSGLGSRGSDFWLGTGFGDGGSALGSVGSITVESGWSFVINSFDAWTGRSDGNEFQAGVIRFIGTTLGGTTVEITLNIPTPNNSDFVEDISFTGTSLAGVSLTSLEFELVGASAPVNGTLDYLALDYINYDASRIQAPAVPEPSTFALLGIGGLALVGYGWRRKQQQAA